MNKKFSELFSGYGMSINGNYAYGLIKGYETNVVIRMFDNISPVTLHVSCYTTPEQTRAIEQTFLRASLKFFRFAFTDYGVSFGLNDITAGKLIKRMPSILNQIFSTLADNGALDSKYCPVCGNELSVENSKKTKVDGFSIQMDQACISALNNSINAENKDFEEAPNNYVNGFFGAMLGGFIGAIIAIGLYMIGFVSSISAFVAVLTGVFFYKKFHGKPNMMMIAIVALTTLAWMVGSVFIIYISVAYMAVQEANMTLTALEGFKLLMQDSEFAGFFSSDLSLTLLFSLLGIGYQTYALTKAIKRKKAIQ